LHLTNSAPTNKPKIKFHNLNELLAKEEEEEKKKHDQPVKANLVEMDETSDSSIESDDDDNATEPSSDDETSSDSDSGNLDFWEFAVKRWRNVLAALPSFIRLYEQWEVDDLLQDIMEDVQQAISKNRFPAEAVDLAVDKRKDLIMDRVSHCPDQDVVSLADNMWCSIASRRVKPGCKW
jgi:hypothetical protein